MCTCEDVLSQSEGAAVFPVEQVLLRGGRAVKVLVLGGGGALQVLHRQTLTQDVLLQVGERPQLSIKQRDRFSLFTSWLYIGMQDVQTNIEIHA